jgi:putative membrane protein
MVPPGSEAERQRLLLMARKLYRFMTILMVPAVGFGLVLWLYYGIGLHGPGNGWMHAKLTLVLVLLGFHFYCKRVLREFEQGRNVRSHRWFRWFNEIPTIAMFIIVPLVIIKPSF